MTSFNAPAILMPLDEYYTHYVQPKPKIPKHYGFHPDKRQRQAAHLQSYKDTNGEDEDEADDDESQQVDELNSSIQDTNMNQINFETNDFNRLYQETDAPMDQTNNTKQVPNAEVSADSAQWRIQPNNVNRPPGAAPLVPSDAPRNQPPRQNPHRGNRWHQNQNNRRRFNRGASNNNYNNNNNNNFNRNNCQNSVHNRLGNFPGRNTQRGQLSMEQRMRNAYNAFIGPPNNNNNNNSYNNNLNNNNNNNMNNNNNNNLKQQQVLMNMNNHFQNGRPQLNVSAQLNPSDIQNSNFNARNNNLNNQFKPYQNQSNPISANWQLGSNSLTALINSANQVRPSMTNPTTQAASLMKPTAQMPIGNNTVNRLGPPMRITLNSNVPQINVGQPTNLTNRNAQMQRAPNGSNGGIVASDSLRLADLMNMDKSSCMNLNVAEVAKNAMMLLSTVFHKPILDEDVQQELSHLQQNNGLSEEPHGLDMNISPETTDLRMYHRFK
ncbi:homeobox protein 2 [Drosophila montana]|uniref:homeobox protein 2 n=1 Tax=Drosophila montana TaxID=40370 RepID=UPI00313B766C